MFRSSLLALALAAGALAPVASARPAPAQSIAVDIKGFAFAPTRVEVHVGDTVEWTNRDFAPHTATSATGVWSTPELKAGATGRFVAKVPGVYAYICKFHPQMKAVLVVTAR